MNTIRFAIFVTCLTLVGCSKAEEKTDDSKTHTKQPQDSTRSTSALPLDHPRLHDNKQFGVRFIVPEGYEAMAAQAPQFVSIMNQRNGNMLAIGALTSEQIREKPDDKVNASTFRDSLYDMMNVGATLNGVTVTERSRKEEFGDNRKFYSFTIVGKAANGFSSRMAYISEDHNGFVLTYNLVVTAEQTFDEVMGIFKGIETYKPGK